MKWNIPFSKMLILAGLSICLFNSGYAQLQDENKVEEKSGSNATFSAGADLVSRYIWRGADYGNSPAIQPAVAFSVAGFKAGFWGSYGLGQYSKKINDSTVANMGNYAEFDMYLSYSLKGFTIMAYDYFMPNSLSPNTGNKYFNFNKASTGHTLEVCLSWAGPEKFPLQLFAGTLVYGADKDKDANGVLGAGSDNNYSTYFEAAYQFNVKGFGVKPFVGGIPFGSAWYGPYGGVVNAGFTVSKSIVLSKEYSLPVFGSVITNPQAESVYMVFGISL
ncbi:MAG: TorF family putative porin [Bacteroidales bacterium]